MITTLQDVAVRFERKLGLSKNDSRRLAKQLNRFAATVDWARPIEKGGAIVQGTDSASGRFLQGNIRIVKKSKARKARSKRKKLSSHG